MQLTFPFEYKQQSLEKQFYFAYENLYAMNKLEKIKYLNTVLETDHGSYADSFKSDISLFFDQFALSNPLFNFLDNLNTPQKITEWVNKLTSRIVMHEEEDLINEIIWDYWLLG